MTYHFCLCHVTESSCLQIRGGSRCKSDGCQGQVAAKPPQDRRGGGEALERHGGPGAEPLENFLGPRPLNLLNT